MSTNPDYVETQEQKQPDGNVDAEADAETTGSELALRVVNLLGEHRALVETVSLTKTRGGCYHVSFSTYATSPVDATGSHGED